MKKNILIFLVGAFSMTQINVVGYIGISELVMFLVGPFLLLKYGRDMKRDGFLSLIAFTFLWIIGAIVTDWYRGSSIYDAVRGLASPLSILFVTPCLYLLLRDDLRRIKWIYVGFAVTTVLSIYVLPTGAAYGAAEGTPGASALEMAREYKLARVFLVASILGIIPVVWYLKVPRISCVLTIGIAIFALFEGGRSSFLVKLISVSLFLFVDGSVGRIRKLPRIFPVLFIILILAGYLAKIGYEYAVTRGYMGDDEMKKHEVQASSKFGLLLGGRSEILSAYFAVLDSPILGHGSWPLDYKGYNIRAAELMDIEITSRMRYHLGLIRCHSHITTAYVWHGVLGFMFWCYCLYIINKTFFLKLGYFPELFGYFVLVYPSSMWAFFFSPFNHRIGFITLLVMCLFVCMRTNSNFKLAPINKNTV